jgi:predicted DNA-binding transcriptional regulator YafY
MPSPHHPLAINLARVVQRLLLDPRGWRVDRLMSELSIQPRTYRKYRSLLQDHGDLLIDPAGRWRVVEVREQEARYLRLVGDDGPAEAKDGFLGQVAAFWLARQVFSFAEDTALQQALDGAWADLKGAVHDRSYTIGHLLRDVDRMIFAVPDAPKSFLGSKEVLATLLRALFYTRRVRITYRSLAPAEPRTHTLCPLTLASWRSALYLVAAYEPDGRPYLFAVDRIVEAEPAPGRFQYPPPEAYDPAELFAESFGIWQEPDTDPITVTLRFAPQPWLHRYVTERTWHPSQAFTKDDDGWLRMTFVVRGTLEVTPWVRSFGADVAVVSPANLLDE